jgi:hypothetical protein
VHNTTDLRGRTPGTASGTSIGGDTEFADNQFQIFNILDNTKIFDFDLDAITTGNTRTATVPDANITMLTTPKHDNLTDGGETTLHFHNALKDDGQLGALYTKDAAFVANFGGVPKLQTVNGGAVVIGKLVSDDTDGNEWTSAQNFDETALTSTSNAVAWDVESNQDAVHTLTEHTTVSAPSNLKAGGFYSLRVIQAAGAYTLAWNAVFKFGSANPDEPAANGDVVIYSFRSDGTNLYGVDAVREEA